MCHSTKTRMQRPIYSIFSTLALNLQSKRYWKILVTLSWKLRATTPAITNLKSSYMVQLKECSRDTLILNWYAGRPFARVMAKPIWTGDLAVSLPGVNSFEMNKQIGSVEQMVDVLSNGAKISNLSRREMGKDAIQTSVNLFKLKFMQLPWSLWISQKSCPCRV